MYSLLGKIVDITAKSESEPGHLEIKFKPACIMPRRTEVPEWLKDQTLLIERTVGDPREVGYPGDSIILTPLESKKWLYPLTVSPDVAYGELPKSIHIELKWWKDEKAPDYTVRANGRQLTGKLEKKGDSFYAEVETGRFYDNEPKLPVEFEVTCDKMKVCSSALPLGEPFCKRILPAGGELYRIKNDWYSINITAAVRAGALISLTENGRGCDHFRVPDNLIQDYLLHGGHCDCLQEGWHSRSHGFWPQPNNAGLSCAGTIREDHSTKLVLDGFIDEGIGLRTTVTYALRDDFPLISWQRSYHLHPKKPDEKKDKNAPIKEPIDDAMVLGCGFRGVWMLDKNSNGGSRVICCDGDACKTFRCGMNSDTIHGRNWSIHGGWVIMEHPCRKEYSMYLFDPDSKPRLKTWFGPISLTLEPWWSVSMVRPGEGIGHTLGLTAGEICGADISGAWVACMTKTEGGLRCGVIARTTDAQPTALFMLGGRKQEIGLDKVLISGLGQLAYGVVDFESGDMDDEFDVCAAGIESRRL